MKAPRFMIEYLNYRIKIVQNLDCPEEAKTDILKSLNGAIIAYKRGLITVDECMEMIARAGKF